MKRSLTLLTALLLAPLASLQALDYPHITAEPQKTGWPLTAEERAYVTEKAEHDRRPGRESNKHLPQLWPVVPSAGHFGGDSWLKLHEAHVKTVQANQGPIDVLLVGDSITIQWGESWKKHFPDLKAVNIGIGGDKTQNVLWRLDHGGVEGLQPKAIVLMIGNNNMFFTPETGIEAAAKGIEMCVKNLREKFPAAKLILAKILPAHAPGNRFYEDIKKTNAALDTLKLASDPKVSVLDLTTDFTNADGTLKKDLFTPDNIHLSPAGYAVYAEKLKPLLEAMPANAGTKDSPDAVCGVGIRLGKIGKHMEITTILPGSPASAVTGLRVGDRLLAVGQGDKPAVPVKDLELSEVVELIRGKADTVVHLMTAHADENDASARMVSLIRKPIAIPSQLLPKGAVPPLKPGDAAPKLRVGAWIQGEPVAELELGKAYLVEFWSTWCAPCVQQIPHLNETHERFKDKGLVVIGQAVSKDDLDNVKPFVAKMGGKMTYRVALDDFSTEERGAMSASWCDAAGQAGIPAAFLVGKDRKIAWIGHPGDLTDAMIESVLNRDTGGIATNATTVEARRQTQYLLLNYSTALNSPQQGQDMMSYVRETFGAANRTSRLKAGLAILYTPKEQVQETAARLRADLELAQQIEVPVLIQVDTENWLPASLTNWFDPSKPGFDPSKVNDVEWTGWTPDTAVKLCWRNWGTVVRVGPHPNLLSPRFQAWEKSIYDALAPVVVEWLAALPAEKRWLFVGWKCGWETTPNSQYAYFKNGNSYLTRTDDPKWIDADKQLIGYNAARTGGFQASGELSYEHTYDVFMKIIGAHLSFLAKTARSLGLPREKLFAHTIAQGVDRYNMDSQFNADSNPSPSFYGKPTTSLRDNPSLMRCLAKARAKLGTTGYGIGEFVFGADDYDTWHRWFTEKLAADPDLIFASLYNYDKMHGHAEIERSLLDAMKKAPN